MIELNKLSMIEYARYKSNLWKRLPYSYKRATHILFSEETDTRLAYSRLSIQGRPIPITSQERTSKKKKWYRVLAKLDALSQEINLLGL